MSTTLTSSLSTASPISWTSNSQYCVFKCDTTTATTWASQSSLGFRFQLTDAVVGNTDVVDCQFQVSTQNTNPLIDGFSYLWIGPTTSTSGNVKPTSSSSYASNIMQAFNKSSGELSFNFGISGTNLNIYAGTSLGKYLLYTFDISSYNQSVVLNSKSQIYIMALPPSTAGASLPKYDLYTKSGMNTLSIVLLVVLLIIVIVIIIVIIVVIVMAVKKKKKNNF